MRGSRAAAALGATLCLAGAADPGDRLENPSQEARARSLFRETRCLVCQGQSIDDSDALLAGDLRRLVRQQVAQGRTDSQIRAFLAERYGDFVLLRPPFSPLTAILWLGPFAVVAVGAGILYVRAGPRPSEPPLSPKEEAALAALGEKRRT
jgi:cytochrome c-type biogenesis protein CcmH